MRNNRRIRGFTMAELLIVVAIMTILGGVSFIAVHSYQRGMAQLDRDAMAKELFVAAQNHLTMADSQGFLGVGNTGFGTRDTAETNEVYYYVVNGKGDFDAADGAALSQMLPFASVDETVRTGSSYIIRYQRNPAVVLDVFFCSRAGTQFGHNLSAGEYATLVSSYRGEEDSYRQARRTYGSDRSVLGWYGGVAGLETGETLLPPVIEVINAEKLTVNITDTNRGNDRLTDLNGLSLADLKLIIEGEKSGAMKAIALSAGIDTRIKVNGAVSGVYTVVLDDVTESLMRFAYLESDTADSFIPGENLTVSAVAYSNKVLTNIAYSNVVTTNSLFADLTDNVQPADPAPSGLTPEESPSAARKKVALENMRHLENLDGSVSNFQPGTLEVERAEQTVDLDWTAFRKAINADAPDSVSVYYGAGTSTKAGSYKPVDLDYALVYDGKGEGPDAAGNDTTVIHRVSNVLVEDYAGSAGMFGFIETPGSAISNVELIDFSINSTGSGENGSAGALAGRAVSVTAANVLAHNTAPDNAAAVNVTGTAGAGGLIGTMVGGTVDRCAAALVVSGRDAGGLVGAITASEADAGAVQYSYSGGHTKDAAYYDGDTPIFNVTGTAGAGGLIGVAGGASIKGSYSTCSATGATAGGLVGTAEGAISGSYATGLVRSTASTPAEGAFAGALTGAAADITGCKFFELVNGAMPAVGEGSTEGITVQALDESIESYDAFVQTPDDWQTAKVYDTALTGLFGQDRYSLQTVAQLNNALTLAETDFVAVHYGDWPALETLVINVSE